MAYTMSSQEHFLIALSESRRRHEIEKTLMEGKRVAIPPQLDIAKIVNYLEMPMIPPMHDELIYDQNSLSYKTKFQQIEIDSLKKKIQDKEKAEVTVQVEEKMKLENLMAYYYNR